MRASILSLGAVLLGATAVIAQSDIPSCSLTKKCPESAPCCSQYGQCGTGAYCLGGCDPRMSFSMEACVPSPVCQNRKMKMDSTERIADISEYLGDADKADWVASGEPIVRNGNVHLTMAKGTVGTVLSSTAYLWYGSVKARMRTSRGAGVITGFILFSDVKDEIDYEWVGADLEIAQTNYYFQGIPLYTQSKNISMTDTYANWHTYEIQWTPDKITWLVNGQVGRVKERKDTWNETAHQWDFPQTPSRVQFSLWPGGLQGNPEGTVNWAGGYVDWDSEDIQKAGYYHAAVADIEIECWDGKRGEPGSNSGTSYTYSSWLGTNDTVVDGDENTVLKSLMGSGLDMDKEDPSKTEKEKEKPSATDDEDAEETTKAVQQIPGGTNPGTQHPGGDEASNNNNNGGGDGGSGNGGGSGGGNGQSTEGAGCDPRAFDQDEDNCGGGSSSSNANQDESSSVRTSVGASTFAALIAVAGLFLI